MRPGRVVALALLEGPRIAGLPSDAQGFIPVTELGEVRGLDRVYAAGDATAYPIKHGGVAAQQADVVAAATAARAGLTGDPQPLQPVIRGALLTGLGTRYLEATPIGDGGFYSTVSDVCPWDPPTKIAAHHPGPYLARGDRHAVRALTPHDSALTDPARPVLRSTRPSSTRCWPTGMRRTTSPSRDLSARQPAAARAAARRAHQAEAARPLGDLRPGSLDPGLLLLHLLASGI